MPSIRWSLVSAVALAAPLWARQVYGPLELEAPSEAARAVVFVEPDDLETGARELATEPAPGRMWICSPCSSSWLAGPFWDAWERLDGLPYFVELQRVPEPKEPVFVARIDRVDLRPARVELEPEVDAWDAHENHVTGALVLGAFAVVGSFVAIGVW